MGRRPNSAGLGLEQTGAALDGGGFVAVDAQRRSADPAIFAVGDVVGEPMLAHKATHEARVAVEAIAGKPLPWDARAIPAVVYTDPEIAWVGLTEAEAADRRIEVQTSTLPWAASGRATTLGRTDGATKLVVEPHTDRVLGVGIVGVGAGDLISERRWRSRWGPCAGPRADDPPAPDARGDADERRCRLLRAQPGLHRPAARARAEQTRWTMEFAFLSDFAEESAGSCTPSGIGVDTIHAAEVPARHPQLTMVAQIRYSVAEAGTHRLEVSGYDADGNEIIDRIQGDMPLPPVTGGTSGTARVLVNSSA